MPSPFPGMNPYLEQHSIWHDFHLNWVVRASGNLAKQVRPKYIVTFGELIFSLECDEIARSSLVSHTGCAAIGYGLPVEGTAPIEAIVEKHRYLEFRDRESRQLVTVIELLSPSSKRPGPDREQYRAKRRQLTHSGVHVVELDLLRGGPRLPLDGLPPCDYYAMVARAEDHPRAAVWPIRLRDPLPTIPVPLRAPDPDAKLDLQALLHQLYDAAGYEDYLYADEPQPALDPEQRAWAGSVLRRAAS
jgi:hypothetical protein